MKRVKNMIRSVWIRAQCVMHDNRGISVIELNSGNSSTNENFKEMLKNLVFSMILGFC